MAYLVEQLINGVCQGAIYALFAIGYTIIVGVVGLVSFTYGEVIMLGAFAALYTATLSGGNIFLTIVMSFLASGVTGIVIHKVCYEHFFEAARYISLICTIGMSMLVKNLVQIFCGSETKPMPAMIRSGGIRLGSYQVTYVQIAVILVVVVLCTILSVFLNRTRQGIILRAVSQDRKAAGMVGIDVNRATLLGNVIGCGIGGVAGMLYALYYGSLSASMGGMATMKAFSSSVLGGLVDTPASAAGGLLIGILENFGVALFASSFRDMIAFVFLIIVLIFFPKGLRISGRRRGK
ncbi:MAG: branched-chain amino acid ABC transporter permease [Lachnospiraceae bacterium]|jgi:branched-chain amino acid transport system permease protein|nr:branched-chain amino acid ABC transporter permease [Lachnospiraceae bacterium]